MIRMFSQLEKDEPALAECGSEFNWHQFTKLLLPHEHDDASILDLKTSHD